MRGPKRGPEPAPGLGGREWSPRCRLGRNPWCLCSWYLWRDRKSSEILGTERNRYFYRLNRKSRGYWPALTPLAPWQGVHVSFTEDSTFAIILFVAAVHSLNRVRLCETPRTAARRSFLSFTVSCSLPQLTSAEPVILSNHLILCRPLLLWPSIFSSIRVFPGESALYLPGDLFLSVSLTGKLPVNKDCDFLVPEKCSQCVFVEWMRD